MTTMRNFIPSLSAGFWFGGSHETAHEFRQRRDGKRPQQAPVVSSHPACVLRETEVDQFGDVNIVADGFGAGHGKIVVLYSASHIARDTDALPDQKEPHGQHFQLEERPAPKRQVPAMPGRPVDEEQNMPRLFMNNRFESVDQFRRKKSRTLGGFEQPEGEEAVNALTVSGYHEGPLRIAAHNVFGLGRKRNAIRRHQIGQYVL